MPSSRLAQGLVAVFSGAALLLNFPLLGLWDHDAHVFGVPLLPAALFGLWFGLIAALAWLMESAPRGRRRSRRD